MMWFTVLKDTLLSTFFPPRCVSCKKEGDFLCSGCVSGYVKKKVGSRTSWFGKKTEWEHLDGVIYALDYAKNPQIQAAIRQFKYRFTQELAGYFADLISEKLCELKMVAGKTLHLVPIPLHKSRLRYRGFNQAMVISENLLKKDTGNKIIISDFLSRVKDTSQQAKLNKKERHMNLKDAFRVTGNCQIPGGDSVIFLVDDVCSTGATLENAAKVLKSYGFHRVYGLVVARAMKEQQKAAGENWTSE
jgi:ComF family protein